jgi:hypothetical protein
VPHLRAKGSLPVSEPAHESRGRVRSWNL